MEYRHYHPQEVWRFHADGGGERFARCESKAAADLLVRLLNDNLAALKEGKGVKA